MEPAVQVQEPLRLVLIVLLIVGVTPGVSAQEEMVAAPEFSILVAGPDPLDSDSLFGHTAILVKFANRSELAYTYEVYALEGSWEVLPSASIGRAIMEMKEKSAGAIIHSYQEAGREIRRTPLQLTPGEATDFAAQLAAIAASEGPLPYDMIYDNCSTRIRDLINALVAGRLETALNVPSGHSVRSIAGPYMDHRFIGSPIWMFLGGQSADVPLNRWDTMFIPLEFESALKVQIGDGADELRTLAGNTTVVTESIHAPYDELGLPWWSGLIAAGAAVFLLSGLAKWNMRRNEEFTRRAVALGLIFVGLATGLMFIFMVLGWANLLGSQAARNQNLLIASPLSLLLVMAASELWGATVRGWRNVAYIATASASILIFAMAARFVPALGVQTNWPFILFAAFCWGCLIWLAGASIGWKMLFREPRQPQQL
jgi:hypothetical protein